MRANRYFAVAALAGVCVSCASNGPLVVGPDPKPPATCKASGGQEQLLLVDWSGEDRGELEAAAKRGTVVVQYANCEMQVLPRCRAYGSYHYTPLNPKHSSLAINDEESLYASLPLGAAKLAGKLRSSGSLSVSMMMIGKFDSDVGSVRRGELAGDCDQATHVVTAITVGAFELSSASASGGETEISLFDAGLRGGKTRSRQILNRDGDPNACEQSESTSGSPPSRCSAVMRVALKAL